MHHPLPGRVGGVTQRDCRSAHRWRCALSASSVSPGGQWLSGQWMTVNPASVNGHRGSTIRLSQTSRSGLDARLLSTGSPSLVLVLKVLA